MKNIVLLVLAMFAPSSLWASPYFRRISADNIQQSAGFLYDPRGIESTVGVSEVALITHSTRDGSLIPREWWSWIPPEDWSPLAIGGGGSLEGNAVIDASASVNLAPQIGALLLKGVTSTSPRWLQVTKGALLGSSVGKVRIGWAAAGNVVRDGVFQSFKEAFPGRGPIGILREASRIEVGYCWTW